MNKKELKKLSVVLNDIGDNIVFVPFEVTFKKVKNLIINLKTDEFKSLIPLMKDRDNVKIISTIWSKIQKAKWDTTTIN